MKNTRLCLYIHPHDECATINGLKITGLVIREPWLTALLWRHFACSRIKKIQKYRGDLNNDHLNTGNFWIPNFLKFRFQMIWYSNGGWMCLSFVLDQNLHIECFNHSNFRRKSKKELFMAKKSSFQTLHSKSYLFDD